jgi:O-antigen ligase
MAQFQRHRRLTLLFLALTLLALLGMGVLKTRRDFLTRGMPRELPGPIHHGGARLGINVHLEQYEAAALDSNLEQIRAAGIHYVKQSFYFDEPFDWAAADRLIAAVAGNNLLLVPLLNGNPANGFAPPQDPARFAAWAGDFARRYRQQLTYYIIWDEPNLTSQWGGQPVNPAEYAALLTAAAQAIRAADAQAVIVAAPLAPTVERGPYNLNESLFLQALYDVGAAGAFDVVSGKPYGFHSGPGDRRVEAQTLNFSRVILLRELLERNGDGHKAIWAGNWGWNSLPDGWQGPPSIWGQTDEQTQAEWTLAALERARREWPWMGVMFLENWQPATAASSAGAAGADDPRWGFSIAGRATESSLRRRPPDDGLAYPGFYLARPDDPAQSFSGGWRFSPEFGADISQQPGDSATFHFWGTDAGLWVRRANYRARLHVTVDGQPANALPRDEHGAALVLTAPDKDEEWLSLEVVARNLEPGPHTLTLVADRGWDQWALHGFTVTYRPPDTAYRRSQLALGLTAVLSFILAMRSGLGADWGSWAGSSRAAYRRLALPVQLLLTALVAAIVALSGWLTWGEQAAGVYRRLGDGSQLAVTATVATIFYFTPAFVIYAASLAILILLIYFRPAWGLVLIAFAMPFYVPEVVKPVFHYHFSPVEIFTLATAAALVGARLTSTVSRIQSARRGAHNLPTAPSVGYAAAGAPLARLHPVDRAVLLFVLVATLSLFFTERLNVATSEWRTVILGPALFYGLLRAVRPTRQEMWLILDGFVLSGLVVALHGLWQYGGGAAVAETITAEGGLERLTAFYGSPNNVALYLGRLVPLLLAMMLLGTGRRRLFYTAVLLPIAPALLLTFSKGSLFLGVPVALLIVFSYWQWQGGRRVRPWLVGALISGALALLVVVQIPQLAGRLNPLGETSFFRVHLWRSALNMIADRPLFGVGLDNFLYAYRGRYIFEAAWQEPDLNHPHNIVLDFASRLGLLGLLAGGWLWWRFWHTLRPLPFQVERQWQPIAVGLVGAFGYILAHGLVDHSFFLVDLAYVFFLLLGTAVWLEEKTRIVDESSRAQGTWL